MLADEEAMYVALRTECIPTSPGIDAQAREAAREWALSELLTRRAREAAAKGDVAAVLELGSKAGAAGSKAERAWIIMLDTASRMQYAESADQEEEARGPVEDDLFG
jgi:hypothetical protein